MSELSALNPRELLRLLAEQQTNISQLQRLVIEHVLAEGLPGAVPATPSSLTTPASTNPEPPPVPTEHAIHGGSSVASAEPAPAISVAMVPDTVLSAESASTVSADVGDNAPTNSEPPPDQTSSAQPAPADSPFGEAAVVGAEATAPATPPSVPMTANPRASRYLKARPVAAAKQVTTAELHRISRLCDVGDAAHLVLQFGEYRGATLFQVAQADPDYIRSLALTAQWPQVRAAALQLVRALHGMSREQANAYSSFSIRPRSFQAWLDEGKGMSESLNQAAAVTSFGAVPLIVLSRDPTVDLDQDWQRIQTELLGLSSNSQQLFANESGHNVEFDQPEAAVGAIEKMVELTRHGLFGSRHD